MKNNCAIQLLYLLLTNDDSHCLEWYWYHLWNV